MKWYHILAKKEGEKRAMMLCAGGRTRLRIHAYQYAEDSVDKYVDVQRRDNPGWTFAKRQA